MGPDGTGRYIRAHQSDSNKRVGSLSTQRAAREGGVRAGARGPRDAVEARDAEDPVAAWHTRDARRGLCEGRGGMID